MSILFSGDFHAGCAGELGGITKKALVKKYGREKYEGIKFHVILGDGGFMWPGCHRTDLYNYKALARRPFPVLCVLGNHEPIYGMAETEEADIGVGERVLLVRDADPLVAYLKRGKAYEIGGFKCLALGGARSVDRERRKAGHTWWPQECWSEREERELFELLREDGSFDLALSHTGPDRVNRLLFGSPSNQPVAMIRDEVALLNDRVDAAVQCEEWLCGHWHRDARHLSPETGRGYQYLYRTTKILDKPGGQMAVHSEHAATTRQTYFRGGLA